MKVGFKHNLHNKIKYTNVHKNVIYEVLLNGMTTY